MDFFRSIVTREFARMYRARGFYRRRMAFPGIAAACVFVGFAVAYEGGGTAIGLVLFSVLGALALFVAAVVPACGVAPAVAHEGESRAPDLLLLANVSPWQLIAARFAGCTIPQMLYVLSVMPLFILCVSLGGVNARQILLGFVILLSTALLSTALGFAVALLTRNPRRTTANAFFVSLLFFGLPPFVLALLRATAPPLLAKLPVILDEWLVRVSPVAAFDLLRQDALPHWGIPYAGFCVLSSIVLLAVSAMVLGRTRQRVAARRAGRLADLFVQRSPSNRLLLRERPLAAPVVWFGVAAVTWITVVSTQQLRAFRELPYAVAIACACVAAALLILCCCRIMRGERHTRTLELLLLTDLSAGQIIAGRLAAACRGVLPWLVTCSVILAYIAVTEDKALWAGDFVCLYIVSVLMLCTVALYVSLRVSHQAALAASVVLVVVWVSVVAPVIWPSGGRYRPGLSWMLEIVGLAIIAILLKPVTKQIRELTYWDR